METVYTSIAEVRGEEKKPHDILMTLAPPQKKVGGGCLDGARGGLFSCQSHNPGATWILTVAGEGATAVAVKRWC